MLDENKKGYAVVNYLGERPATKNNGFYTVKIPSEVEVEIVTPLTLHSVSYFYSCKDISIPELAQYIPSEIFAEYLKIESTSITEISPVKYIPKYNLKLVRIENHEITTREIYALSNIFVNKFGSS